MRFSKTMKKTSQEKTNNLMQTMENNENRIFIETIKTQGTHFSKLRQDAFVFDNVFRRLRENTGSGPKT